MSGSGFMAMGRGLQEGGVGFVTLPETDGGGEGGGDGRAYSRFIYINCFLDTPSRILIAPVSWHVISPMKVNC